MTVQTSEQGMRADQRYLTTSELAARWRLSRWTLRQFAKAGRIRGAQRLGRDWRFPEDAVLLRVEKSPRHAASRAQAGATIARLLAAHQTRRA